MKKKFVFMLMTVLTLCTLFSVSTLAVDGDEFADADLNYIVKTEDTNTNTGTVSIIGYCGSGGNLTIPQ